MSRLRRTLVLAILVLGAVPPIVVSAGSAQAAAPVDVFVADVTDSPDPVALGPPCSTRSAWATTVRAPQPRSS